MDTMLTSINLRAAPDESGRRVSWPSASMMRWSMI